MENQDKLYDKIQQAAKNTEANSFPGMEKVWARVEEKLDKKEDKKVIALWKKIAVAASLLLFVSIGYQFLKSDKEIITIENPIVIENKDTIQNVSPLKIEKPEEKEVIVSADVKSEKNSNTEPISKESILKNSIKKEQVISVFNDSLLKLKDLVALDEEKKQLVSDEVPLKKLNGEKVITGTVMDNYGMPLPGATIIVRGTNKGISTDFDGKFSILLREGEEIEVSFIGYKNNHIKVAKGNVYNFSLVEDNVLSEVVVTGYAIKKERKSLGYAVSAVTSKDIATSPSSKVSKTLVGKAPGVAVQQTNGLNGSGTNIVVRGYSSLKSENNPLYIVDGVPLRSISNSNNNSIPIEIKDLDPNTIDKIDVLKGLSATALYGSAGKNGVIIITTKNGKVEKLSKRQLKKRLKELEKAQQQAPIQWPINDSTQDESYESFEENAFESPSTAPLSTFSIDVDNASYTNIRRFINNGQTVPKDAVRVEEMVNFFKYNYAEPINEHPFSFHTEYSDCTWNNNHKILKVGLQGKNIPTDNLPSSNLVFLIDVSGSMNDQNKLPLLKQSMKILVEQLRKKDKVSIVVYAGAAGLVLPPTSGDEKKTIIDALENLQAGGSTAGGEGIELAYKIAQENFVKNGNNRVILATDGDFNVGASSDTDMQTLIEEKRKSGVFLTCLGYGMGNYKDSKMETIANKGNGNYAYIDNIQEANRFLGKEFKGSMFAIAKDVKIQIEFNPQHVQAYRLIGYENRKLKDEDFVNDANDAGELGSGHTVTALYEIIPTNIKSDFFKEPIDLKYSKTESSSTVFGNELGTIKFRYKKPDGDKSIEMVNVIENKSMPIENSSDDFKFSSAIAWFGLKLRDSKLVQNKDSEAIKTLAKKGLSNDEDGYKAEFIRLVETVK
jgi:Ca-activated chloride channel family protein